jgi:hypothetical protein
VSDRKKMPTHWQIAKANAGLLWDLGFGLDEARQTCWSCCAEGDGAPGLGWLQRAHVVAKSAGGGNDPSNFFLLCGQCHREQPDGAPRAAQEAWLRRRESQVDRLLRLAAPVAEHIVSSAPSGVSAEDASEAWAVALESAYCVGMAGAHKENAVASLAWGVGQAAIEHMNRTKMGSVPYGYALAADGVRLVEVDAEQAVVREARTLRASGLSLRQVGALLAERGLVARSNDD